MRSAVRVEFRLFGAVRARAGQGLVDLGPAKQRCVLAVLLMSPGRAVAVETLIDRVWGDDPPDGARSTLYSYLTRLRRALVAAGGDGGPVAAITRRADGYLLEVPSERVDVHRFGALIARAREAIRTGDDQAACGMLTSALALCSGPPLADLSGGWVERVRAGLDGECLAAATERIDALLRLGRHAEVLGELAALTAAHPLDEHLIGQLMLALYRCGRQADALEVYRATWRLLHDELGIQPGPELERLHQAILAGEPALTPPAAPLRMPGRAPSTIDVPRQLPPDIDDFTGREAATAQVQQLLEREQSTAIIISAIAGKAGVGKTALAVHVAHRLQSRFPDGQLYVDLRGAEARPRDPAEVLAGFLRAVGVERASIADGLEERVRQFRARLADRRVLVVLDNAASEAQLRPLLPGCRGCAALVTSRARLGGLEAAHPLTLEVLEPEEAVALLARLAGAARVAAEPQAAQAIVRLSGLLPLAVRIAGARLAARPQWRLAVLAERLADEHQRLDELTVGDLEVRASIALSDHGRGEVERRLFRLLGLLVAPTFVAWVAAALLDTGQAEAEALLEGLVDAQLVEAAGQDQAGQLRYRLHDLLRIYARERLEAEEPVAAQQAALGRMLHAYLLLAERADARVVPSGLYRYGSDPTCRPHADHPMVAIVERDPLGWFEAERTSLVAAVEQGCQPHIGEVGWQLAESLAGFFQVHAHWDDWQHTHTVALAAARRADDRPAEARILASLSALHDEQACADEARRCLHQSLTAFRETGNRRGELQCLLSLCSLDQEQGRYEATIAQLERILDGFRKLRVRSWEALALYLLGTAHEQLGRLDAAVACLSESLTLMHAVADRPWEAAILRRLGLVYGQQGRLKAAVARLQRSLVLVRAADERSGEMFILQNLGELYRRQGRLEDADSCLQHSLELARAMGKRNAEARALHTLGDVRRVQGRPEDAGGFLERSLAVFRDLGFRHWEARVLNSLGLLLAAKGDHDAACSAWRAALTILRELDMPEAADVAARLDQPGSTLST
jgi:DNA-binding SARP family transcriptional activator/tetratricopeptide (TPR) repeat protein